MSGEMRAVTSADIDELMTWFDDSSSIDIWGGPRFRYPFSRRTFHNDCRWKEYGSYCLYHDGDMIAFGQIGVRYGRCHFARLVVRPDQRGAGVGKILLRSLIEKAKQNQDVIECGLFVYRHNKAAYHCYHALGFRVQVYPDDAPMRGECYYMTRPIDQDSRS